MKKLTLLQIFICLVFSFATWLIFDVDLWQILLFIWIPVFVLGYIWFWWFRNIFFFRDPERKTPTSENCIVAPADGRVMYIYQVIGGEIVSDKKGQKIKITELAKTEFEDKKGWLIGTYMSPFDVHFNRAPIDGKVELLHYHQTGINFPMVDLWEYLNFTLLRKAINMFAARYHFENERMTFKITNRKVSCILILIADKFVNKITTLFNQAEPVVKGQKIAFIERGSQTDLFIISENISFNVKVGDQTYAGETIIARF